MTSQGQVPASSRSCTLDELPVTRPQAVSSCSATVSSTLESALPPLPHAPRRLCCQAKGSLCTSGLFPYVAMQCSRVSLGCSSTSAEIWRLNWNEAGSIEGTSPRLASSPPSIIYSTFFKATEMS